MFSLTSFQAEPALMTVPNPEPCVCASHVSRTAYLGWREHLEWMGSTAQQGHRDQQGQQVHQEQLGRQGRQGPLEQLGQREGLGRQGPLVQRGHQEPQGRQEG